MCHHSHFDKLWYWFKDVIKGNPVMIYLSIFVIIMRLIFISQISYHVLSFCHRFLINLLVILIYISAKKRYLTNGVIMFGQHQRRWANINPRPAMSVIWQSTSNYCAFAVILRLPVLILDQFLNLLSFYFFNYLTCKTVLYVIVLNTVIIRYSTNRYYTNRI